MFHHDELAEGVVEAGRRGSFEPWVAFGDAWLRIALAKLIQLGSHHSSSLARDGLAREFPDLLSGDELLAAPELAAEHGDAGHAYPEREPGDAPELAFGPARARAHDGRGARKVRAGPGLKRPAPSRPPWHQGRLWVMDGPVRPAVRSSLQRNGAWLYPRELLLLGNRLHLSRFLSYT